MEMYLFSVGFHYAKFTMNTQPTSFFPHRFQFFHQSRVVFAEKNKSKKPCDKRDTRKRKPVADSCSESNEEHKKPASTIRSPLKRRRSLSSPTERNELVRQVRCFCTTVIEEKKTKAKISGSSQTSE